MLPTPPTLHPPTTQSGELCAAAVIDLPRRDSHHTGQGPAPERRGRNCKADGPCTSGARTHPAQGALCMPAGFCVWPGALAVLDVGLQGDGHAGKRSPPATECVAPLWRWRSAASPPCFQESSHLIPFSDRPTHTSQASLTTLCIPLRPTAAELAPLSAPRDALPRSRLTHQLTLTYSLTLAEGGTVTPRFPRLNRLVYDGILDGQMHVVTDANKKVLGWGDIYPEVGLGRGTGARREGVCDRGGGVCLRPYSPSEGCGVEEG